MQKIYFLSLLLLFTSCGINVPAMQEETCTDCSEPEINSPLAEFAQNEVVFEPSTNNFFKYRAPKFNPAWQLSEEKYEKALRYYERSDLISNPRYLVIIDFSKHSSEKRFYLFDMLTGIVSRHLVAHGLGSDLDNDGFAQQFSNIPNSKASSVGFYLTLGTYEGKNGLSLRIRGLSNSNSNAETRGVVVHGSRYVRPDMAKIGRSWGCPALEKDLAPELIQKIKAGALMMIDR